ncbi:MAG: hypothetical protein ABW205_04200 [Burkholderiales bacterium]
MARRHVQVDWLNHHTHRNRPDHDRLRVDHPLIPIGQRMLRRALRSFEEHYHRERTHQGIGNVLIMPRRVAPGGSGTVVRRPRLGGLRNFYVPAAA